MKHKRVYRRSGTYSEKACKECTLIYPATTEYFAKIKTWFSSYCRECAARKTKRYEMRR